MKMVWDFLCSYYEIYMIMSAGVVVLLAERSKTDVPAIFFPAIKLSGLFFIGIISWTLWQTIHISPDRYVVYIGFLLLKIGIVVLAEKLFFLASCFVIKKRSFIIRIFDGAKYGIACFVLLSLKLFFRSDGHLYEWASVWYVMHYGDGVGSRLLPGTILHILTGGGYLTQNTLIAYVTAAQELVVIMVSVLAGFYLKRATEEKKKTAVLLFLIYFLSPANIAFLWTRENMGRVETFVLIFLFLSVLLFSLIKNRYLKYAVLALLSVICMACYQAYLFLYFPIVFTVMVVDVFSPCEADNRNDLHSSIKTEGRLNKSSFIGAALVCLVTALSFFFFQFFSYVKYDDLDQLVEVLSSRTDMEISVDALYCEEFGSVSESWRMFFGPMIEYGNEDYLRELGFLNLLINSPIILMFIYLWKNSVSKGQKTVYVLIGLGNLAILPQFMLTMDWGRWIAAGFTVQFFELMYLFWIGEKGMRDTMESADGWLKNHKFIMYVMVMYLSLLLPFHAALQSEESRRLLRTLGRIIQLVVHK